MVSSSAVVERGFSASGDFVFPVGPATHIRSVVVGRFALGCRMILGTRDFFPSKGGVGAIFGPPGCGKSVLSRVLAGACLPSGIRAVGFDPFNSFSPNGCDGVRVLPASASAHDRVAIGHELAAGWIQAEGGGLGEGAHGFLRAAELAEGIRADVFFCDELMAIRPFPMACARRLLSSGIAFVFISQSTAAAVPEFSDDVWSGAPIVLFAGGRRSNLRDAGRIFSARIDELESALSSGGFERHRGAFALSTGGPLAFGSVRAEEKPFLSWF
jgi:hypothetical protein